MDYILISAFVLAVLLLVYTDRPSKTEGFSCLVWDSFGIILTMTVLIGVVSGYDFIHVQGFRCLFWFGILVDGGWSLYE